MKQFLHNLLGIGKVTMVDDSGELQLIQITEKSLGDGFSDQVSDDVRRFSEFGFASVPPIDSEALLLRRNGDRSSSTVIATSHRPSRPTGLQPGDAGIYDVRGAKVMLTENGLLIDCAGLPAVIQNATTLTLKASQKVTIDAPDAEFTGTLHATGTISTDADVTVAGNSVAALRTAYDGHKHTGVKAGTDTSAGTDTAA